MFSPIETSSEPRPLGNWVKFGAPCILIPKSFRIYEYMPLVLPILEMAGVGPRLPHKYSCRNLSWRIVASAATRERKSERLFSEGPEKPSEGWIPLKKSRITGVDDAAIARIWSALSMTVVLSKVCSMTLNSLPERLVRAAAATKEPKPEQTSSSRMDLSPFKKSIRRERRSKAERPSQPLKSKFHTGLTVPWHKRYKYEAVSMDNTSKEVTVALAEINANELGPSGQPKNSDYKGSAQTLRLDYAFRPTVCESTRVMQGTQAPLHTKPWQYLSPSRDSSKKDPSQRGMGVNRCSWLGYIAQCSERREVFQCGVRQGGSSPWRL